MARLLYITNGLSGGLNASYELARRLTKAGHSISFLGHRDLASSVQAQGYQYTQLVQDDTAMGELGAQITRVGHLRSIPSAYALRQQVIQSREVESAVAAQQPDGLLIDIEAHYCALATRSLRIPTVLKSDWFSFAWQPGIPPLHSSQRLPDSWSERRLADARWVRTQVGRIALNTVGEIHPRKLARRWAPFRYDTVSRRDLRAVARARDLRLRDLTSQRDLLRPHTYPDIPLISSTARELDFVTKPAPNDHAIGPLVYRDRVDTAVAGVDRKRWHDFQDRNRTSGRPLIYCAFGTILPETSRMLERVIGAVRARDDCDLVIALGGRAQRLGPVAEPNILVLDYAPQLEVLGSAAVAITHGGVNTINECVTHGVPMVLEQSGATDQPGNASRVEHHGIGLRAELATIDPRRLNELIDQALADTTMHRRVNEMRANFQRYQDDRVAERTIEKLLAIDPSKA